MKYKILIKFQIVVCSAFFNSTIIIDFWPRRKFGHFRENFNTCHQNNFSNDVYYPVPAKTCVLIKIYIFSKCLKNNDVKVNSVIST